MHGAGDGPCQRGRAGRANDIDSGIGKSKFRRVEQIESFRPELQVPLFTEPEILEHRCINVVLCWPAQSASSGVSKDVGAGLAGSERRNCVGSRVVPAFDGLVVGRATYIFRIREIVGIADNVGTWGAG